MPTEVRPSAPIAPRERIPKRGSRDVTPSSFTALVIIAALILVLHVAASTVLAHPRAYASMAAPDNEAECLGDTKLPVASLPFD